METTLNKIAVGEVFGDISGQRFIKLGVVQRRQNGVAMKSVRHVVRCVSSPCSTGPIGPVTSAFFTRVGQVLFLAGSQPVQQLQTVLLLCDTQAASNSDEASEFGSGGSHVAWGTPAEEGEASAGDVAQAEGFRRDEGAVGEVEPVRGRLTTKGTEASRKVRPISMDNAMQRGCLGAVALRAGECEVAA